MAKRTLNKGEAAQTKKTDTADENRKNGKNNINNKSDKIIQLSKEQALKALRLMLIGRTIDTKALNLLKQGKTFFHIAGSGHEAIQVAAGLSLDPKNDWFFPYYRDVAFAQALGVTPNDFFLQCFAKDDDPASGGRQLPCHWGHPNINLPTQSSPTGTQFLQALGAALAISRRGKKNIAYVSSGEGTSSQGEFHEAVNWASRSKLPVLFIIENNKYAISVPVSLQSGGRGHSVSEMMAGYANLYRARIDGTDYIECIEKVREAIDYIKSGKGPALIEAEVVRLQSHSSSDDQKKYRSVEELERDLQRDPIQLFYKKLLSQQIVSEEEFKKLKNDVEREINEASDWAIKAADPKVETADKFIFDESGLKDKLEYEKTEPSGSKIVMVDSLNHALMEEMERDDRIYMFGEDIADSKGGVFTVTKGLTNKFGEDRVFNSPLAEASILGVAIGMALTGLKPVVEIQFGDYIWPAFMQMKNELATYRYRSKNNWPAPVVIRVAVGGYIHGGLYHSQNIESIFAHVPGIYIAFPSNAADAKGLMKTAIRLNDPVLFCEHKGLYRQSSAMSPEPDADYLVPFGKAKVVREGTDVTVISYGVSMWDSLLAAKKLEDEGYSVEVIDLRTIIPLDEDTIYKSVKKTNKAIIIHEDTLTAGFGAEIAARVADNCFQFLDGPVKRIAALDTHIPYSPILENAVLPNRDRVYKGIKELLEF